MPHNLLEEAKTDACEKYGAYLDATYTIRYERTPEAINALVRAEREWHEATVRFCSALEQMGKQPYVAGAAASNRWRNRKYK